MSKIVIEDIKKDRRSLREVIPSHHSHHSAPTHNRRTPATSDLATKKTYHEDVGDTESSLSWLWGVIIVISVVVLIGYFVAPIFTQVTVTVLPKEISVEVNEKITAIRDAAGGELTFTVLPQIEKTAAISVPATGNKYTEAKASGKIRIINNFSADPQPLVATTRFSSPKGKIYRIAENITVPGMKAGKAGTVEAMVYADKAGSDYNDGLTTFTIPGFADSPKATKITAQSITPILGGIIGNIKVVSSTTEASVRKQITSQLENDLKATVKAQIPDGFFTNNDLTSFNYEINQSNQSQATNTAVFSGKGRATAIIFNESSLAQVLVGQAVGPDSAKNTIKITNLNELSIKTNPPIQTNDLKKLDSISLEVVGKAHLLWQIDQQKLISDLVGQQKSAFADIFKGYGESITSGEVSFRPSWSDAFPTDPERISIKLLTANKTLSP